MASADKTENYNLSQFGDSDKPSWRGDYSGDMSKIDTALHDQSVDITTVQDVANTAKTTADGLSGRLGDVETEVGNIPSTFATKAEVAETYSTKTEVSSALASYPTKTEQTNTLLGYPTRSEQTAAINSAVEPKANSVDVYTKTESDNRFEERKDTSRAPILVTFGDSYAAGTGANKWPNVIAPMMKHDLKNYAVSGAGWGVSGLTFKQQIDTAIADASLDKTRVDTIILAGGRNDIMTYDQTKAAAVTALGALRSNFPDARIIVAPMLYDKEPSTAYMRAKAAGALAACLETQCEGINWAWTWNIGLPQNFPSGDIHPNEAGAKVIAGYMYQAVKGTYCGRSESWYESHNGKAQCSITASSGFVNINLMGSDGSTTEERKFSSIPAWARPNNSTTQGGTRVWGISLSNSGSQGGSVILDNNGINMNGNLIASTGTSAANTGFNTTYPW